MSEKKDKTCGPDGSFWAKQFAALNKVKPTGNKQQRIDFMLRIFFCTKNIQEYGTTETTSALSFKMTKFSAKPLSILPNFRSKPITRAGYKDAIRKASSNGMPTWVTQFRTA